VIGDPKYDSVPLVAVVAPISPTPPAPTWIDVDTGCAPIGVEPVLYAPAPPPVPALDPPAPPPPITTYSTSAAFQFGSVANVPEPVKV